MMRPTWTLLLALLLLACPSAAVTFTEDFESFAPGEDPDQTWYNYRELSDNGTVNNTGPVIEGNKSLIFTGNPTSDVTLRRADIDLEIPTQLTNTTFFIQGEPPANVTGGSQQFIAIESSAPRRTIVEFYLFCADTANPNGCELRVRFDHVDTTGQTLINTSVNQTRFKIELRFDWINAQYRLFVDDIDDGLFPFLELPDDVGRIRFGQHRGGIPWQMAFDNWTIDGAVNGTAAPVGGDVANGIKSFASDIRFDSAGSAFLLGILIFLVIMAGVVVPLISLGRDNTIFPALTFFAILVALWLITMEFWPDWIGIAAIILVAALIALSVRRLALGIRDGSTGAGLVVGSLGYFIIASSLLAFSGYATDTVILPTAPNEQQDDVGGNTTDTQQTFVGAVTECIFTIFSDCSQETVTTTWKKITDAAGQIYGWVQASVDFVFQLLTFSLPIPVLFNIMIVGPPATGLAAYAIGVIRGVGS